MAAQNEQCRSDPEPPDGPEFVDGLSAGNSDALALLVEDYFYNNEGMHKTNNFSIHDTDLGRHDGLR